jgi:MoxR-like ATPase
VNLPEEVLQLGTRLTSEILSPLKRTFVGKDDVIDLAGICLIARENLFILGPPGTAKSAIVHELGRRLQGRSFEYLLTRFTEPNELFGPFDIRRLREGELVTNTEGMLPEAALVFLDELLNANSAILNSLLMVLNERVLRRGRDIIHLPTVMVIGASNHLPEEDALRALFDRFLLRVRSDNVPEDRLDDVLRAGWQLDLGLHQAQATFTVADATRLHESLPQVNLDAVRRELAELVIRLRRAGIAVSDRRAVKLQRLVAASALISGRLEALASDLWVFRHIWDTLEQQEVLVALVQESLRKTEPHAHDHPRARAAEAPDPEELARDLETLQAALGKEGIAEEQRAILRDQLGILAGRAQWIKNDLQRQALQKRVDELWTAAGAPS